MGGKPRKSFLGLFLLTLRVIAQVLITPLLAFSVTYFFDYQFSGSGIDLDFRREMLPWIFTASLIYAMVALLLALSFGGGFRPLSVIERGGWLAVLGLTRRKGDASLRREARRKYAISAHGRLSLLVHERHTQGHRIISTHGGLVLLAIPLQVILATVPLALVLAVPETIMREDRRLEMALFVYLACFVLALKLFPWIAKRYIGLATFTRRWLGSMGSVSNLTPFLVLWVLGRVAHVAVLGSMGQGVSLNIQVEKELFETSFSIRSIPDTSFVDLLTALAVMPLAAFTTLAALGAGADPPEWMYEYHPKPDPAVQTTTHQSSSMLRAGATVAAGTIASVATVAATSAAAQTTTALQGLSGLGGSMPLSQTKRSIDAVQTVVDVAPVEAIQDHASLEDLSRSIDVVERTKEIEIPRAGGLVEHAYEELKTPSFDEPSITGLRKGK